jgi:branched-chain amino acid transport system ATP-binding protein
VTTIATNALRAFYGDFQALFDLDVELSAGQTTAIIGANGAGKSTFMKALTGLVKTEPDMIRINGEPAGGRKSYTIIKSGIAMVPEGRRLFSSLSVEENLVVGTHCGRKGNWNLERVYELFPVLKERKSQAGMSLSGGQQQMVAIGRALLSNPDVLLCDEVSLGLAPAIIEDLYKVIAKLRAEGMTIVIVEQDILRAMSVADYVYCFQEGRVSLRGHPKELGIDAIRNAYFGV